MRSRIKDHRRVRAGDLVPHELNPRIHSDAQRNALRDLYERIGFARSVLAYELPDGRLKLIDGHLRASTTPDEILDVEVLDVNDTEARALLLSLDPLAQLADYDNSALDQLREITKTDSPHLTALWESLAAGMTDTEKALKQAGEVKENVELPETFAVIVQCTDERHQLELYRRFKAEGLTCKVITS
jgi:hypothetical protein